MADADDPVRVLLTSGDQAGRELSFWQAAEIGRGLDRIATSCSVAVGRGMLQDAGVSRLPLVPGTGVELRIGDDLVFTGWVDKIKRSRTADEHAINMQARSVAGDLVDCSAGNSPGQWRGVRLSVIATALVAPFGVPITVDSEVDHVVADCQIEQGETVFEVLERLAHAAAAVIYDTPAGVTRIARLGDGRASTRLLHRDGIGGGADSANNVLESVADFDASKRFSVITVKGQSEGGASAAGAYGSAKDDGVTRYRPLILSAPGQATAADCQRLAQWEVARRTGKAVHLVHQVRGWRQSAGGPLWTPGLTVGVTDDQAEIDRDLLIVESKWVLDQRGRRTELVLEPPEAWAPKPVIDKHVSGGGKWAHVAAAVKGH